MKAIMYRKYGSVENLSIEEVKKPKHKDNEVLVKVHSASINKSDLLFILGKPVFVRLMTGLFKPKGNILGSDIAGTVMATGRNVTRFKVGDRVFGDIEKSGNGGFSEFVAVKDISITHIPDGISFEVAAASPRAGITSMQTLIKSKMDKGHNVLLNGASGGVGSTLIQMAKTFEANVTAVVSTRNKELAKANGADEIIDYTKDDFTKNGKHYDIIIGVNGYVPIKSYRDSLSDNGIYIAIGGSGKQLAEAMFKGKFLTIRSKKKITSLASKFTVEDLEVVRTMLESKQLLPCIDKTYKLTEYKEAFLAFSEGHTQGKIIINFE